MIHKQVKVILDDEL